MIPWADPRAGYLAHREEVDAAINRVLDSGRYILGDEVEAFESAFAEYHGLGHAVGVGNGTDALELALRSLDIGPGDEVITVSHTAVATVAAVHRTGATPVVVDIEHEHGTMHPGALDDAITERTRAVVPVHLYGQPCDMPSIMDTTVEHDLAVVEDCAQAHGASLDGRKVGTFGDAATFSFYPTKNLGALGDGGAVVTDRDDVAERARRLRQYGWDGDRISLEPGGNSRLDEVQAAVLRVKLGHLDENNERRRRLAGIYHRSLAKTGVGLPSVRPDAEHVFHLYVVRSHQRDRLRERLQERGVATGVHYSRPVHRHPGYADEVRVAGDMDATDRTADEVLSLPMYPELEPEKITHIADAVDTALEAL